MPDTSRTHVEIYVFRRAGRRVEFLCLRRAASARKLPGVWQPVTGKVNLLEQSLEAAVRETLEETGLTPRRWWALETVSVYFDPQKDTVRLLPMFAAEAGPRDVVRLSKEHQDFEWLSEKAFASRVLWEMQRRGLEAVRREVLSNATLAAALDVTGLAARWMPKTTARVKAKPRARRGSKP
jgi:dATP pyrophosphohydrolase